MGRSKKAKVRPAQASEATKSATNVRVSKTDTPQRVRIRKISAQLFAERGYNAVGMAAIGDAVGLARGALYHHIGSKEELLYDVTIRYMLDLVEAGQALVGAETDPPQRIKRLSRHLIGVIAAHLAEMTVCFREVSSLTGERYDVVSRLHAEYQDIWATTIAEGAGSGVFRRITTVELKGLLGMYFYSFLWFKPHGDNTPEQIAEMFSALVIRALAPDART